MTVWMGLIFIFIVAVITSSIVILYVSIEKTFASSASNPELLNCITEEFGLANNDIIILADTDEGFEFLNLPKNGTIVVTSSTELTYTPNTNFVGSDSFAYKRVFGGYIIKNITIHDTMYENDYKLIGTGAQGGGGTEQL